MELFRNNWYTLVSQGALTTQWTPPSSCLATTTLWGSYRGYFLGFHEQVGIDLDCYPSLLSQQTASVTTSPLIVTGTTTEASTTKPYVTITGFTTYTPSITLTKTPFFPSSPGGLVSDIAFYSPGVCPSGYSYAVSYTFSKARPPGESRYVCCPSGYTVQTYMSTLRQTAGGRIYTSLVPVYSYPSCSSSATSITNLWSLVPGWPTVKPESYQLTTTSQSRTYESFLVRASGLVVGWQSDNAEVLDFIRSSNVTLPRLDYSQSMGSSLTKGAIAGIVIGALAGLSLLLFLGACCLVRRRRKQQTTATTQAASQAEALTAQSEAPQLQYHAEYIKHEHSTTAAVLGEDAPPSYEASASG